MERRVLITGASGGIGAATARLFAQAGWEVALHYFRAHHRALALWDELQALGVRTAVVQADISQPEQAAEMVETARRKLGELDAVVCSAGSGGKQQLLTDTDDSLWRELMGVNLDGVFYTLRAVIPHMVRRQQGSIVTVSSMWGVTGGSCEVAYSAAKAGVIGLTRALAKELGPSHINVNCVAPGVIDTDMNRHLTPEDLEALAQEAPLCRIGTPEEAAQAILFLASDQAKFITGQVLRVDGGMVI